MRRYCQPIDLTADDGDGNDVTLSQNNLIIGPNYIV